MGQKGPPSISNPSSFQFITAHTENNNDKNKTRNNRTENPEDEIDNGMDELSEQEWFQIGVDFVLS